MTALKLSQMLQAGVLYREYQSSRSNPQLANILDSLSIASNGEQLELSLDLNDEEVPTLIEHNTFSTSTTGRPFCALNVAGHG
jgi:hypothetical protein